jgi:two-component system sensor histidine kinase KdpD
VSQAALSSSNLATVYPMALWQLNDALGLTGSRLLLVDGAGLVQVASSGTLAGSAEERTWLEQVVRDQRGLVIWEQPRNNVRITTELDLAAPEMVAPEGAHLREVLLPLRVESVVHGVVVVGAKKQGSLAGAEDHQLLVAFANQLAVAVERQGRAEQQARARALEESDRLKSALVSSVSHELKTPLAAIKASVTTLLSGHPEPDARLRRELSESINRETDRLTRLVSSLLDMSRLEAGALRPQLEWASLADVVAEVLDRMEPIINGRDVRVDIPDDMPPTRMDFVQISQVLTNLLDNAVRYSPPGAAIRISASFVRDHLRVTVFNEGSPLPPAELDKLFDKFYRLSPSSGGIGLGLSIVRGIVEAHGGRAWAENVGRRGVAVTFTLPSPPRVTPPTDRPPGAYASSVS